MQGQQENLVSYPANELLKKCKCHEDIVNICREMGTYIYIIYQDIIFQINLDMMVISFYNGGHPKKRQVNICNIFQLFELGKVSGYSFRYFTKDKSFTKAHIIRELSLIPEAKLYLPDNINIKSIGREYLFAVSYYYNF